MSENAQMLDSYVRQIIASQGVPATNPAETADTIMQLAVELIRSHQMALRYLDGIDSPTNGTIYALDLPEKIKWRLTYQDITFITQVRKLRHRDLLALGYTNDEAKAIKAAESEAPE